MQQKQTCVRSIPILSIDTENYNHNDEFTSAPSGYDHYGMSPFPMSPDPCQISSAPLALATSLPTHFSSHLPAFSPHLNARSGQLAYSRDDDSDMQFHMETVDTIKSQVRKAELAVPTKKRKKTSPEQLATLCRMFNQNPRPTTAERLALAQQLGMTPRAVQVWFQNKRMKQKSLSACTPEPLSALTLEEEPCSVPLQRGYSTPGDSRHSYLESHSVPSHHYIHAPPSYYIDEVMQDMTGSFGESLCEFAIPGVAMSQVTSPSEMLYSPHSGEMLETPATSALATPITINPMQMHGSAPTMASHLNTQINEVHKRLSMDQSMSQLSRSLTNSNNNSVEPRHLSEAASLNIYGQSCPETLNPLLIHGFNVKNRQVQDNLFRILGSQNY